MGPGCLHGIPGRRWDTVTDSSDAVFAHAAVRLAEQAVPWAQPPDVLACIHDTLAHRQHGQEPAGPDVVRELTTAVISCVNSSGWRTHRSPWLSPLNSFD